MEIEVFVMKFASIISLVGALLLAVSTVFHPVVINPWPFTGSLQLIAHSFTWMWDHWLMAISLVLWLTGIATLVNNMKVYYLFGTALAMWLLILANELTVLPFLVERLMESDLPTLHLTGTYLFALGLMGGYFAIILIWIGVILIGWRVEGIPRWVAKAGILSGGIGIIGIIYIFIYPEGITSIFILGATSGLPYLWTLLYASLKMKTVLVVTIEIRHRFTPPFFGF
jgi:hypothetical protein